MASRACFFCTEVGLEAGIGVPATLESSLRVPISTSSILGVFLRIQLTAFPASWSFSIGDLGTGPLGSAKLGKFAKVPSVKSSM